jgi:preprotein translocase subunit SecA
MRAMAQQFQSGLLPYWSMGAMVMSEQPRSKVDAQPLDENQHEQDHSGHVHGPDCQHDHHDHQPIPTYRREMPKLGRNDPCYCGSGKKFKKCHGEGAG